MSAVHEFRGQGDWPFSCLAVPLISALMKNKRNIVIIANIAVLVYGRYKRTCMTATGRTLAPSRPSTRPTWACVKLSQTLREWQAQNQSPPLGVHRFVPQRKSAEKEHFLHSQLIFLPAGWLVLEEATGDEQGLASLSSGEKECFERGLVCIMLEVLLVARFDSTRYKHDMVFSRLISRNFDLVHNPVFVRDLGAGSGESEVAGITGQAAFWSVCSLFGRSRIVFRRVALQKPSAIHNIGSLPDLLLNSGNQFVGNLVNLF